MDQMYYEIREQLRQSHAQNLQDVYQRERNPIYPYNYNGKKYVQDHKHQQSSWTFSLNMKIFLFLAGIISFSCYIYGGQDFEKGAKMAFTEAKNEIHYLEEKEPKVKEAMVYLRKAYHEVNQFADTYILEQDSN